MRIPYLRAPFKPFLAVLAALAIATAAAHAAAAAGDLRVIAPAASGGGWDQTARAMRDVLESVDPARAVEVVNIPGAGGTVGLAQVISGFKGSPDTLMVSGLVMVGAVQVARSPATLDQVTPIARLTGEYEVIVVPAASPIRSMEDLLAQFRENPGAVSWGGGSAGGADHMLVGLLATAVGVDPASVNYVPFSGGGEALAAILGGHVTVGVSGWSEFASQVRAGTLRALAISAPAPVADIGVPTLKQQGVNLDLVNWRGVVAPPGITDEQKRALADTVEAMARSPAWKATLERHGWLDLYQTPDQFAAFLRVERGRVQSVLRDIGLLPRGGQ
ncbi:tripartite tricarboxylate transporter substrate binding protein [Azospirillum halopraeferens]|uniref:tripartite tricarboxylate transporter substrate binding protein n=1 Tax=Azospirillum halopraeferens TaxID=34010 RepID=UPI0004039D90|nr:tripartite tricarboxylate transporter substrate-binding protein [Azospirillum halopraeferens]